MKVKLIDKNCVLTKGYTLDVGFDCRSREEVMLKPFETRIIPLGFKIEVPVGWSGDIRPRSSISKNGLLVHYGTVDPNYRGEVGAIVTNLNIDSIIKIDKYQRIAQLVISKVNYEFTLTYDEELSEADRGEFGFGSTGK